MANVGMTIELLETFRDRNMWKEGFMTHEDSRKTRKNICGYAIETIKAQQEEIERLNALLKEQQTKKSKDEVLTAIISTQGYTDAETFKRTVLEIDNFEDYFLGGLFRAVKAVEKLFDGQ